MSMPLGRVIDATTQKVYGDLSMMVDLMRDMRPDEDARRKKDLADFVNVNRKRLMRLLVVLKWLPQAPNAAKAAEILEATGKRSLIYGATANGLHQHWETVKRQWKMPSYAVPAAVDILGSGKYARLPYCIIASAPQAAPTPAQAAASLEWLNHHLHLRLIEDRLPDGLDASRIEGGRLWIKKNNLFEISLTLRGPEPDAPWRLLSLDVLVTDPSSNGAPDARALFQDQRYAVRCLDFFCTALQLTVMTSQAYTLAQGRMRKALGVTVAGGHSLELVYWHKGGPVPSGNRPVPHFSVLKIELIREMRAEGDSSGNTDAGSGGGGGGGGGVSAGTTATSSSSSSRSATPIQTPTPLGESNNHTILRAVHTPPLLDPATDHPFDFTALCTEVSVPLLLDKAMQLQTHIQLKRIHDELEAAATTAATEASTPTTPTTTTMSTSTFTTAGAGSGSSSGTATGAASVGTSDNLAARHVTYTLHEGLSEDYSNVSRLDFTFQGSSQSPASPTQAAPITISLTYGARGFSFYEDGQQGLVRKQCAGAATGTVEGFYLNQAAHALNAGISSAAEAIKRLQARASLADLAVQGRRCGLDAIFVHQPLIARMADNPHRVLHMRFRHFPLFTFVVELQADGIEEQYFLLQSESANGSPLVQTNYTQWSLSSLPSVQILHSMNGDAVGEGGEGGGGASAEAGIGGAAAETEDDGDERPRQRLKLDPLAGNAATSNANANTNAATTFGNVVHLCQQQIPMVLLSQQLSAMNFSYTLDAAGSKAVIHHHAVISGKRLYADVESMQFAVRGAECRVELIFAAESLCGRASKALAICGHDNVTFNPETRQVAFEYKEVNSCVGGFFFHFEIACYLFELVVMLPTPGSEVATLWPLPPGFSCEFGFTHLAFAYGGGHRAFVEWSPEHQVFSLALSTTLPGRNPHSQIGRQLSDELFGDVDINEVLATLALTLGPLTCLQACTKFEAEMSYLARSPTCGLLTCHGVCALELTFVAESRVRIKDGGCVWQEQQQDAGARASASSVDHGNSKAAKHASMKPVVNLLAFVQKHGASSVDAVTGVLELPLSTFEAICSVDSAAGGGRCLLHAFMVSQKAVAAASQ